MYGMGKALVVNLYYLWK